MLIFSFFVIFTILLSGLYFYQLSGYVFKWLLKSSLILFLKNSLIVLVYFVLYSFCKEFGFNNFILFLNGGFVILYLLCNISKNILKTKITRRVWRIILCYFLLDILCFFVLYFYVLKDIEWGICFFICIPIVVNFITHIILMPIEKCVGNYYILKAQKKLSLYNDVIKIGITGSYGKTSVKEICKSILSQKYNVLATPKSFNTPFGISKTINNELDGSCEIFVMEMGAKARGEIKYLTDTYGVDMGVVTSVGRQHTNTFKGIDGVYKTKKELPDALKNKTCIFNLMNIYTSRMSKEYLGKSIGVYVLKKRLIKVSSFYIKKITCIQSAKNVSKDLYFEFPKVNVCFAKNVRLSDCGSCFDVYFHNEFMFSTKINLLGVHNIINTLLAISIAINLDMNKELIRRGVEKIESIPARIEKLTMSNGAVLINNGYNSNIDSARYSLGVLNLFDVKKKIVITPGLVETENDFFYNQKFGELLSHFCTDVFIIKKKNREAIVDGLKNMGFDLSRVLYFDSFAEVRPFLQSESSDTVFLIENDLPDNFI